MATDLRLQTVLKYLEMVNEDREATLYRLSKRSKSRISYIYTVIKKLDSIGLVKKQNPQGTRRKRIIQLTDKGEKFLKLFHDST